MPDEPKEKVKLPDINVRPDGFWSLPDGLSGVAGTQEGVARVIDEIEKVPAHCKTVLKAQIAAALEGTNFNYVKVLARESVNKTAFEIHVNGTYDIWVSKKNL